MTPKPPTFYPLQKYVDGRGHSLNDIYSMFPGKEFQVNFSILYPGVKKAFHMHEHQDDYFCVLTGNAQVGVFSDIDAPEKFFTGVTNPGVVHIPKGNWHGLMAVGTEPVGLLYLVTKKYNSEMPDEKRLAWDSIDSFWDIPNH